MGRVLQNRMTLNGLVLIGSIWLAVAAWAVVSAGRIAGREGRGWLGIWLGGCAAYWVHAVVAFAGPDRGSVAVAWAETARQTEALTGIASGAGLVANALFGLVWAADGWRWWRTGRSVPPGRGRERGLFLAGQGFLGFLVVNGTVVFGQGAVRVYGLAVFALLAVVWVRATLSASPRKL